MIAIIDNYDSFTYNLLHYLEEFEANVDVYRNDEITLGQLEKYSRIVISPGPGLPNEVPFLNKMLREFSGRKKILGVCLGLQALVEFYGGELYNLPEVLHGRQSECLISMEDPIFRGISSPFLIGHYHSWGVKDDGMPKNMKVLARDKMNRIMMIKHDQFEVYGIQFHPESVLCPMGKQLLYNWLKYT